MNTLYPLKTINQLRPLLIGFRKVNGLSQKDIAERLGVTQQTYARLEANPGSASIERLFKVFTVLGVEIEFSSPLASSTINSDKLTDKYRDSPAIREKW
ncbi:XRE family transcriptional regulator [Salmonella enterica subsp. salamae]|nr:XRE family transcriptional regulator [Salmonella enterica subsp. salamae]